jgi:hypothetical protein
MMMRCIPDTDLPLQSALPLNDSSQLSARAVLHAIEGPPGTCKYIREVCVQCISMHAATAVCSAMQ